MNPIKEDLRQLETALSKANQEKEEFIPTGTWPQNVMRNIRQIGPLNQKPTQVMQDVNILWRIAVCSFIFAIFVSFYAVSQGEGTVSYFIKRLFMDDFLNLLSIV